MPSRSGGPATCCGGRRFGACSTRSPARCSSRWACGLRPSAADVRLRRAGPGEDGDAVARIFLAARAGMTYLPRVHTDEETTRFFRDAVVPNDEVWLAEDDSGTVGFAALGSAELNHLYVRPDAQGRGAGSLLLDRAKE